MIAYEKRFGTEFDGRVVQQHRWVCETCRRIGAWLGAEQAARRNGKLHAEWHETPEGVASCSKG